MKDELKSSVRSMIKNYKRRGYRLEKESEVPCAYMMTRRSRRNPKIFISYEGISFKPYWITD